MMEKLLVPHRATGEMLLQKRPELQRIALLGLRRRTVRQRSFKLRQLVAGQLAVDPRGPFFFKRFHRGPSGGFAVFSGRRKVVTSPCRWNIRALPRSRGIACPRFPSSKSRHDVPAKVAEWRRRSAPGFPAVPSADTGARPPSAPSAKPDRFPSIAPRHRTRCRFLSPAFSGANRWLHWSRSGKSRCKKKTGRGSARSISTL